MGFGPLGYFLLRGSSKHSDGFTRARDLRSRRNLSPDAVECVLFALFLSAVPAGFTYDYISGLQENNRLKDPVVLSDSVSETISWAMSKQIRAMESIFGSGSTSVFSGSLKKVLIENNIEPKELVLDIIRMKDKLDPKVLPTELIFLFRKIRDLSPEKLEKLTQSIKFIKGFEDYLKKTNELKDWREFRQNRSKKIDLLKKDITRKKIVGHILEARHVSLREKARHVSVNVPKRKLNRPQNRI